MSGQLSEIKKKIVSTKNTRKITLAMQLEASSKMKQFQDRALSTRDYSMDLIKMVKTIANDEFFSDNKFSVKRDGGKVLFILYSSDKGLCGSLNTQISKATFTSDLWKETKEDKRILLTIGKKGTDYSKYNGYPVHKSFKNLAEKPTSLDVLEIVDYIVNLWMVEDIKQIVMITPHFKNSLVFYPVMKTFLPFSSEMFEDHLKQSIESVESDATDIEIEKTIIYEPSKKEIENFLIESFIQGIFMQAFYELKASEYSSRMMAMKNATDSADEMVDKLTLSFNKARQAAITQEIAEIVAGASV